MTNPELITRQLKLSLYSEQNLKPIIVEIMKKSPKPLTPREIWNITLRLGRHFELTSVRAMVTELTREKYTKEPKLIKLPTQKMGVRAAKEHLWISVCEINENEPPKTYNP